jgi:predicted RNA-binding protein
MRSINKYYSGDQIKEDVISIAYGTYGEETE